MVPTAIVPYGGGSVQAQICPRTSRNPPSLCRTCVRVSDMARKDWSTADELGWREAAWRWFLARGVKANLAEDLTQEALLRLLRGQQREQPLTRAYLHRVCQSVLYDHLRQCAREPNCQSLDACCCVAVAESGFQQAEDRAFLEQALGQLRPLERAIVEMHHLEEQTFETIAATLGIPVERAKKISQRAIKKMQQWARSSGGGSENGGFVRFWRPPTGVLCV